MSSVGMLLGAVRGTSAGADVWCAWVEAPSPGREDPRARLLSPDERRLARRYRSDDAASRYVATRALVRHVLAAELHVSPAAVLVAYTDLGKPVVAGGVHFNVSHSGDLILVAVSRDRPVGVDIERRRDVARSDALMRRWLTEAERVRVARYVAEGQSPSDAFLRVWSLKEARLKALGVGLSGAPGADAEAVEAVEAVPLDAILDALSDGRSADRYIGAVAFA